MANLKSLNKSPIKRVFIADGKWLARSTGVGGFISSQKGTVWC